MPPPVSAPQTACTVNLGFAANLGLTAANLRRFRRSPLPDLRSGNVVAGPRVQESAWFRKTDAIRLTLGVPLSESLHN